MSDGLRSSWNGHKPIKSAPWRFNSTPCFDTISSIGTPRFSFGRSILSIAGETSDSGTQIVGSYVLALDKEAR